MDKMKNFGDRLTELMFDNNISTKKLAESIGVSVSTVYRWKNNETKLFLSNLITLSNLLNCSIDYVLGRSEDNYSINYNQVLPTFSIGLRKIMKEKGVSTYRLRKDTRYDGKYFQKWDKGSDPLAITLIELADYLDCTIDYLVGREG